MSRKKSLAKSAKVATERDELTAERELIIDLIHGIDDLIFNLDWWVKNSDAPAADTENLYSEIANIQRDPACDYDLNEFLKP